MKTDVLKMSVMWDFSEKKQERTKRQKEKRKKKKKTKRSRTDKVGQ